jgi:hypothetical protein
MTEYLTTYLEQHEGGNACYPTPEGPMHVKGGSVDVSSSQPPPRPMLGEGKLLTEIADEPTE